MTSHEADVDACEAALLALDRLAVARLLETPGHEPVLVRIERLMIPALERIGRGWEEGRVALSQVYMGGRICEDLVNRLIRSTSSRRMDQPRMAVAVLEDYHLLGKRMVYATLRAAGYEVSDYGRTDVAALVSRTVADRVELLLISTLMFPSALRVAQVREGLEQAGCRARVIVGGAPFRFDEDLWREVRADAMCRNASDVLGVISSLQGGGV
ncbi:MAG TPA: cobalamin-dependent protein [Desulfuromonadaceae bacterium]